MTHLKGWRPKRRENKWCPRNEERAERGAEMLNAWKSENATCGDDETDIVDSLSDLLHFAASIGRDPEDVMHTALMHFEAER